MSATDDDDNLEAVDCPDCPAPAGTPCLGLGDGYYHGARKRAADEQYGPRNGH